MKTKRWIKFLVAHLVFAIAFSVAGLALLSSPRFNAIEHLKMFGMMVGSTLAITLFVHGFGRIMDWATSDQ